MSAIKYKLKQLCEEQNPHKVRARSPAKAKSREDKWRRSCCGYINANCSVHLTDTRRAEQQQPRYRYTGREDLTWRYIRNHNSYFSFSFLFFIRCLPISGGLVICVTGTDGGQRQQKCQNALTFNWG